MTLVKASRWLLKLRNSASSFATKLRASSAIINNPDDDPRMKLLSEYIDEGNLPTIASTDPVDEGEADSTTPTLAATFDKHVQLTEGSSGTLRVYQTSGDVLKETFAVSSAQLSIVDETITIVMTATLTAATDHYVQISSDFVEDLNANAFAGIADKTTWRFTTP